MRSLLDSRITDRFTEVLRRELVPALGCTEPIAIAYAAARAGALLGEEPRRVEIGCSGNIIKNVQSVVVPNSGGLRGVEAAALTGLAGGCPEAGLEVLSDIQDTHRAVAREWLADPAFCRVYVLQGDEALWIVVRVFGDTHQALVEIRCQHTGIVRMERDGVLVYEASPEGDGSRETDTDDHLWTLAGVLDYAEQVPIEAIRGILDKQIRLNLAIACEGLAHDWGASVGRTLLEVFGDDVRTRAKARASAGSDARMGGCALPVVINSGSGNQGMTVSLPVIEYALELAVDEACMYRALAISNLVSILQKRRIGRLSAYCGAVSAAAGAGAGIAWLHGLSRDAIAETITNTIANVGGIVCDGAKASCAAKIASSVDAAILGFEMSRKERRFKSGEGLVRGDVDETIARYGKIGRDGMRETDREIVRLMVED